MSGLLLPLALRPEPDPARDLLTRELSRPEYQPSLGERIQDFIDWLLGRLVSTASGAAHPSPVVAVVMLVVLVGLVVVVLLRLQRTARPPRTDGEVFVDGRLGAAEHRALAERALADGRYAEALVESVRALASGLIERGLLLDQPGTTAREISEAAAASFPAERVALSSVARRFEETVYGDRPAGEREARDAVDLERRVRAATPTSDAARLVSAVPR